VKVIAENKISSITASSTLTGGYTTANLLTGHPGKPWQADHTHSGTLTFDIKAGSSGLVLFNTNALSVEASIYDPTVFELASGWSLADGWSLAAANYPSNIIVQELDGITGAVWISWNPIDAAVFVQVTLQAQVGQTLRVGEAVGGLALCFVNPQWGVPESEKDYSINKDLSNGELYTKDRDVVRTFAGELIVKREDDFYTFMQQVSRVIKSRPTAWWLVDHNNDFRWVVYARMTKRPQGKHAHIRHSSIELAWQEVV